VVNRFEITAVKNITYIFMALTGSTQNIDITMRPNIKINVRKCNLKRFEN